MRYRVYLSWIEGGSRLELTVQCCSRTRTDSIELQTKGLTIEIVAITPSISTREYAGIS